MRYFALFFSYIGAGVLGQRIGRRRFFVIIGLAIASVGAAILYVLANTQTLSLPAIIALLCALAVLVTSPWGVIVTYINERFATEVRATGFGVGFSLSVIIPSFYAFYMSWLSQQNEADRAEQHPQVTIQRRGRRFPHRPRRQAALAAERLQTSRGIPPQPAAAAANVTLGRAALRR